MENEDTKPASKIGDLFYRWCLEPIAGVGDFTMTIGSSFYWLFRPPVRVSLWFTQMYHIGVESLFLVLLVGLFTGMVLCLQSIYAFEVMRAEAMSGSVVALTLTRELGPVLASLMVTGRAGSAMTTELGTMRVTEQIDALATMAVSPVQYLILPRLIATTVMMPVLTMLFNLIGFWGGYIVAVNLMGVGEAIFIEKVQMYLDVEDVVMGLVKAGMFGFFIAAIASYKGYTASGGARGVGAATTKAVVLNSVTIFMLDYILTPILFGD